MTFYLAIKPFTKHGINHDKIRLEVDYNKTAKGPSLIGQTVEWNDGSFKFIILGSPCMLYDIEKGWLRNDKKKMQVVLDLVAAQVAARKGPLIDKVSEFLKGHGSEIVEHSSDLEAITIQVVDENTHSGGEEPKGV